MRGRSQGERRSGVKVRWCHERAETAALVPSEGSRVYAQTDPCGGSDWGHMAGGQGSLNTHCMLANERSWRTCCRVTQPLFVALCAPLVFGGRMCVDKTCTYYGKCRARAAEHRTEHFFWPRGHAHGREREVRGLRLGSVGEHTRSSHGRAKSVAERV